MHRARAFLLVFAASLSSAALAAGGCGQRAADPTDASDAASDKRPSDARVGPYHPDASCLVTIDDPPQPAAVHVDEGSQLVFASNPPAGGPHYGRWARWQTTFMQYPDPVPRGYYIHNLEHGGIVFLYKCAADAGAGVDAGDAGTCKDAAEAFLTQAMNAIPTDPGCVAPIRVRALITEDPLIPTPFAAAAWGFTYTSACADLPTLVDFAKGRYGKGTENFCSDGSYPP